MPSCNATVANAVLQGSACTVTIELRTVSTDPTAARSFFYTFPITATVAEIKAALKAQIQGEWANNIAEQAGVARAQALASSLIGMSYDLSW